MDANELINKGIELFYQKQYSEAINKLNAALDSITDKTTQIQQQNDAHAWIGLCYLEQAKQTKNPDLFKDSREHFQEWLRLAELLDEENSIQQQNNAHAWLGNCYLEEATQTKNDNLFKCARRYFQKWIQLAGKLANKKKSILDQAYAQYWLGRCYWEQATQTKNADLFEHSQKHFEEWLQLAERLNSIQERASAQFWLGRCYLEQVKLNKSDLDSRSKSKEAFQKALESANELIDSDFKNAIIKDIKHQLRELLFLEEEYSKYLNQKEAYIGEKLPTHLDKLQKPIASILAVLTIAPIEFDKPLAHYTNPNVSEKLLGIAQKQPLDPNISASKMRMNSSTYMNDPYEGRSLLDFLGIQESSLENLNEFNSHSAFFTCFSARVNDLNQFRLYGKAGNTEASGCCLVFNKNGDWIKEPDISGSYQYLNQPDNLESSIDDKEQIQELYESLPLYQIAYIFYRDDYMQLDEHDVLPQNHAFGLRLKPISSNKKWHQERKKRLKQALNKLTTYFRSKKVLTKEEQAALEYIRYLFKDYAFRDEEEFRLLKIEELGSDKVQYCPHTNNTFLEYGDICSFLDEVILGTNYEHTSDGLKVEVFRHLLKRKQPQIKVSHSSLPIHSTHK